VLNGSIYDTSLPPEVPGVGGHSASTVVLPAGYSGTEHPRGIERLKSLSDGVLAAERNDGRTTVLNSSNVNVYTIIKESLESLLELMVFWRQREMKGERWRGLRSW